MKTLFVSFVTKNFSHKKVVHMKFHKQDTTHQQNPIPIEFGVL